MYSIDEIKELISVLEDSTLSVLELQKEDGSKIKLEKPQQVIAQTVAPQPVAVQAPVAQNSAPAPQATAVDSGRTINAPIVGVFYAASAPGAKPFVSVGDVVKKGEVVCIIEAMKCMNEIQAEEDGEIVEVLAKDGDLVEYDQPVFRIK